MGDLLSQRRVNPCDDSAPSLQDTTTTLHETNEIMCSTSRSSLCWAAPLLVGTTSRRVSPLANGLARGHSNGSVPLGALHALVEFDLALAQHVDKAELSRERMCERQRVGSTRKHHPYVPVCDRSDAPILRMVPETFGESWTTCRLQTGPRLGERPLSLLSSSQDRIPQSWCFRWAAPPPGSRGLFGTTTGGRSRPPNRTEPASSLDSPSRLGEAIPQPLSLSDDLERQRSR